MSVIFEGEAAVEYTFERDTNFMVYVQILPIQVHSFFEPPRIFSLLPSTSNSTSQGFDFLDFQYKTLDLINSFNSMMSSSANVLPPFASHAFISKNSLIETFDGRIFQLKNNNCSYLLAGDFQDNKFSIAAEFENGVRKSLNIHIDNSLIKIDENLHITVNEQPVILPSYFHDIVLFRQDNSIVLDNWDGVQVQCSVVPHGSCQITLSGWFFGKTGGLFGNMDNEPANDFMSPERKQLENVDEFAASWQVSQDDSCQYYSIEDQSVDELEESNCLQGFQSETSSLMPCFDTVDVGPYVEMCLDTVNQGQDDLCSAAAAYVARCHAEGVDVWIPNECSTCKVQENGQEMLKHVGETLRTEMPSATDIVFLIKYGNCLDKLDLSFLASLINSGLEEQDLHNNRFALIGYGGANDNLFKPHIITKTGKDAFMFQEELSPLIARYERQNNPFLQV